MDPAVVLAVVLIFGVAFVNGWTDAGNAIGPAVVTRVMTPLAAVGLCAAMNLLGAFFGGAVATTMGKGIVNPHVITPVTIAATMVSVIIWSTIAWWFGLPTSESHGLIAGFAGAAIATAGFDALIGSGWIKVGIGVVVAIVGGGLASYLLAKLIIQLAQNMSPGRGKKLFDRLQVVGAAAASFGHSVGDVPKFAGMVGATFVAAGVNTEFKVAWEVTFAIAAIVALGTLFGGWRIVETMSKINRDMESWQGATALMGASATITGAAELGIPVSTTHSGISSLTGSCASQSVARVDWRQPIRICHAAILTFLACGLISFVVCLILTPLFK